MPIVNMKQMLKDAHEGHYAIGQFNINNLEWMQAILDECKELRTPVILGVSEGATKYMGGWHVVVEMIKAYMSDQNIDILSQFILITVPPLTSVKPQSTQASLPL